MYRRAARTQAKGREGRRWPGAWRSGDDVAIVRPTCNARGLELGAGISHSHELAWSPPINRIRYHIRCHHGNTVYVSINSCVTV